MASKNFPGPSINHLIEQDPQIVKVKMDDWQWGSRPSVMPKGTNPQGPDSGNAPGTSGEMTIKHTS